MKNKIKSWRLERIIRKANHKANVSKRWWFKDRQWHNEHKQSEAQIIKDLLDYDKQHKKLETGTYQTTETPQGST
jgi:hypothetical protein